MALDQRAFVLGWRPLGELESSLIDVGQILAVVGDVEPANGAPQVFIPVELNLNGKCNNDNKFL